MPRQIVRPVKYRAALILNVRVVAMLNFNEIRCFARLGLTVRKLSLCLPSYVKEYPIGESD